MPPCSDRRSLASSCRLEVKSRALGRNPPAAFSPAPFRHLEVRRGCVADGVPDVRDSRRKVIQRSEAATNVPIGKVRSVD